MRRRDHEEEFPLLDIEEEEKRLGRTFEVMRSSRFRFPKERRKREIKALRGWKALISDWKKKRRYDKEEAVRLCHVEKHRRRKCLKILLLNITRLCF